MEFFIEKAHSFHEFETAWNEGMKHLYWYSLDRAFDYSKNQINEIKSKFGNKNAFFLVAKRGDKLVGALHGQFSDTNAVFSRWEPTVPLVDDRDSIGLMLLSHGLDILSHHKVKTVRFTSVYSIDHKDQHEWYSKLYLKKGFVLKKPAIFLQLLSDLNIEHLSNSSHSRIKLVGEEKYSIDDFVKFTLRSYTATPDDKKIHGYDPNVSDPKQIKNILLKVRNGGLGEYKPEYTLVAELDGRPVGYIYSFIFDANKKSRRGVIGNLGVFPEYRGQGISTVLLKEMLRVLKKHGCKLVQVGTPTTNIKAIEAYKKVGFRPDSIVEFFYKELSY